MWAVAWLFMFTGILLIGVTSEYAHAQDCHHVASGWHPPVEGNCVYKHEHGDAPPSWISAAGYTLGFDSHGGFHGNTSSVENTIKHNSMKGMHATFKARDGSNQEVYMRVHIASNPLERSARYHSYEMFMKDSQGGVSHWQGWLNSGSPDPANGQRRSKSLGDNGVRPTILVTDIPALERGLNCEQWYGFTNSWGPDVGWTICDSTTIYFDWEWQILEYWLAGNMPPELLTCTYKIGLCKGNDRELELAWYGPDSVSAPNRGNPPKNTTFWATQFGEIVSGPNDARCTGTTQKFNVNERNICLSQFIAGTARSVENPNNRYRKTYNVTGVEFPN